MTVVGTIVVAGAVAGWLGHAATAQALSSLSIDKCLACQIKIVGKGTAAEVGCYAKAAAKDLATAPECLAKAEGKPGPALDKVEAKLTCFVEGTGATRTGDVATFASTTDDHVGNAATVFADAQACVLDAWNPTCQTCGNGLSDPGEPVRDEANPTLGSVFCIGVTGTPTVSITTGLPGPGRITLKGHTVATFALHSDPRRPPSALRGSAHRASGPPRDGRRMRPAAKRASRARSACAAAGDVQGIARI